MNITFNYKLNLVVFGNLIFFLLTLYLVSLLTNYFKVSEFGSYNLFISICSVGVLFISLTIKKFTMIIIMNLEI